MSPFRQEVREFVRASETILSLESFGTSLTDEERGAILLMIEDLTKSLSKPGLELPDGHGPDLFHDGKPLADL